MVVVHRCFLVKDSLQCFKWWKTMCYPSSLFLLYDFCFLSWFDLQQNQPKHNSEDLSLRLKQNARPFLGFSSFYNGTQEKFTGVQATPLQLDSYRPTCCNPRIDCPPSSPVCPNLGKKTTWKGIMQIPAMTIIAALRVLSGLGAPQGLHIRIHVDLLI